MTAPDLGSGSLGSEGSTPFARTIFNRLPVSNPRIESLRVDDSHGVQMKC